MTDNIGENTWSDDTNQVTTACRLTARELVQGPASSSQSHPASSQRSPARSLARKPRDQTNCASQCFQLSMRIRIVDGLGGVAGEALPQFLGTPAFAMEELNEWRREWKVRDERFRPFSPRRSVVRPAIPAFDMRSRNWPERPFLPAIVLPAMPERQNRSTASAGLGLSTKRLNSGWMRDLDGIVRSCLGRKRSLCVPSRLPSSGDWTGHRSGRQCRIRR